MTDPFAAYGDRVQVIINKPAPMLGPLKTRAAARLRYNGIVEEMAACETPAALSEYLKQHKAEIAQFSATLELLWSGSDAFLGLEREIALATARVDDGLDFPRWDPGQNLPASLGAANPEAQKETQS